MTTRPEVKDLRIETVLPYIQNGSGINLNDLLVIIDDRLKDAAPERHSPSLINWEFKNLFLDKWEVESGTPVISYNGSGTSKIGKGRFEVTGTGRLTFSRFLAVSEVRGVTGRIFVGSDVIGAECTVGIQCYDKDKTLLGDNGGFIVDTHAPVVAGYDFFKSSAFGESASGERFLKPGTRFVKYFIDLSLNPSVFYFDESDMTTFEVDERYKQITGSEFDWNLAEFVYSEVVVDTTFTFKNDQDGRVKTIAVKNVSAANIDASFPTAQWQGGLPLETIRPGKTSIFTFARMNSILYGSVIEEFE